FNKLLRDYQKMVKDFGDELQKKEEELSVGIQKDLIEFVNKLGKDEGYTIIFGLEKGARGIIYSPDELNLTDKVINKYNEITNAKK
ncbi:MAG: OmpH family outer membrane protein, partial [Nitrospirota bacterium]